VVRGKVEKQGIAINVVGSEFRALEAEEVVHKSRDFH